MRRKAAIEKEEAERERIRLRLEEKRKEKLLEQLTSEVEKYIFDVLTHRNSLRAKDIY